VSSFCCLHYHWICATKFRRPFIRDLWRPRFHQYFGGAVRGLGGVPLEVGGIEDHVHLLVGLKTTHGLADFSRELKKSTSVWAKENGDRDFSWQEGYAVFSVSRSIVPIVARYVRRQEEHHRKAGSRAELATLLRRHQVDFEPEHLE
jgi:putative transposase